MKIILLQDVPNVGKKYEIKEVKDGHARNFLIAKNLAKKATKDTMKWLESQKEVIAKEVEEDLKKAQALASQLDGLEINFVVKVGEVGQLFEPIKQLGEFPVKINLDHNLEAEVMVLVVEEKI